MIKTCCKPYQWWLDLIRKEEPFTFIRYGDGEWASVVGKKTKNCDGHNLRIPQMRRQIIRSIVDVPPDEPNYYRTVWMDGNCQPVENLANRWIPNRAPDVTWYNALAIHFANISGHNYPYFEAMRNLKMNIVVIGPQHLRGIKKAGCFGYHSFVQVPYRTAYNARDRIINQALEFKPPVFYSIHAGPPAPAFAWLLWRERGDTCIIADLGSILDGYGHKKFGGKGGGALTRKFWRERATRQILQRNLRG